MTELDVGFWMKQKILPHYYIRNYFLRCSDAFNDYVDWE